MRITKYLHSCVLVEHEGKTVLFDPGNYAFNGGDFNYGALPALDYILITHEHQDHFYLPFVVKLKDRFPGVMIISTPSVAKKLSQENIECSLVGNELVDVTNIPHEELLGQGPENIRFDVFSKLTHPGDSLQFYNSNEILLLPIQAPWGSLVAAVKKAAEIKPRMVIPIHDWHWRDEARVWLYGMAEAYLQEHGVEFRGLESGEAIEV